MRPAVAAFSAGGREKQQRILGRVVWNFRLEHFFDAVCGWCWCLNILDSFHVTLSHFIYHFH